MNIIRSYSNCNLVINSELTLGLDLECNGCLRQSTRPPWWKSAISSPRTKSTCTSCCPSMRLMLQAYSSSILHLTSIGTLRSWSILTEYTWIRRVGAEINVKHGNNQGSLVLYRIENIKKTFVWRPCYFRKNHTLILYIITLTYYILLERDTCKQATFIFYWKNGAQFFSW